MSDRSVPNSLAALPDNLNRCLERVRVRLADSFGAPFGIYTFANDAWSPLDEADVPNSECWSLADLDRQVDHTAITNLEPTIVAYLEGAALLVLPLHVEAGIAVVAVGPCVTSDPKLLLLRCARLFASQFRQSIQLQRLTEENLAFGRQLTHDLEELVFLRQMSEQLAMIDVLPDLGAITASFLPLLCHAINAKSLVLLDAATDADDATTTVGTILRRVGDDQVDNATCRRLIVRFGGDAQHRPVVRNRFQSMPIGSQFAGVQEFVIVAIKKDGDLVGWLLAVNRTTGHSYFDNESAIHRSDYEFGTGEATLMTSAAAIFATRAKNIELLREKEELLTAVVRSLVSAIEEKDKYTHGHSERVGLFAKCLGREIGLGNDRCEQLYLTGLLHDVGKIGVKDVVLNKTDKLDAAEFEQIQRHPESGWAILHDLKQMAYVLPGVLSHHERMDGKGYPDGLAGEQIPLEGRLLAVCDAYDALTSDRPYRQGMSQERAEVILRKGSGTQWDPRLVEAFFRAMPEILKIRRQYQPREVAQRNDRRSSTPPVVLSVSDRSPASITEPRTR